MRCLRSPSSIGPALGIGHRPGPGAWWHGPGTWWPVSALLWLVLVAVTVAFLLIRSAAQRQRSRAAEEKLAQRYAAGDITEDEYQERLSVLRVYER